MTLFYTVIQVFAGLVIFAAVAGNITSYSWEIFVHPHSCSVLFLRFHCVYIQAVTRVAAKQHFLKHVRWIMRGEWWGVSDEGWVMQDEWWGLSDELWVMRGERWAVSDEWWVMRGEWWGVNDEWWVLRGEWKGVSDEEWVMGGEWCAMKDEGWVMISRNYENKNSSSHPWL